MVGGGITGTAAEQVIGDTCACEYIIHKANRDLLSLTQKDTEPLAIGQKMPVIADNRARVVPDYTVSLQAPPKRTGSAPKELPAATAPPPNMRTGP